MEPLQQLYPSLIKPPTAPLTNPLPQLPGIQPYTGQPAAGAGQPPAVGRPATEGQSPFPILPPPPAPAAPSTFNADSNLIGSQIDAPAPTATAQNTNYGTGAVAPTAAPPNTAFGTGAIQAGAPIGTANSARFDALGAQQDAAVGNLTGGPDRTALAMQKLQDFDTAGQPALDAGFRKVGQSAAKFGRLGAGMTTNDLTGMQGSYDRNKMLLKNDLASSVAEGDINDRFRSVGALSGLRGAESGYQNQNFNQNFANRGYDTGVDQYNQGANFDRMQAANQAQGQYQDRAFGQGQYNEGASFDRARAGNQDQSQWQDRLYGQQNAAANAQRGERGYQYGLSEDARQSEVQRKMVEDQLLNSSQGRALNQFNAGNQGNPSDLYQDFAGGQDRTAESLYGNAGGLFGNVGQKPAQPDYTKMFQEYMNSRGG